jgi:hypothetical protein
MKGNQEFPETCVVKNALDPTRMETLRPCGSTGADPEGRRLSLRIKVVIQRVQLQNHEVL